MKISQIKNGQFFVVTGGERSPLFQKVDGDVIQIKSSFSRKKRTARYFKNKKLLIVKKLNIPEDPVDVED